MECVTGYTARLLNGRPAMRLVGRRSRKGAVTVIVLGHFENLDLLNENVNAAEVRIGLQQTPTGQGH